MDQIVIDGVAGYDGRYDFDLDGQPLTTREWGWIKRLAGYLPLNIEEGLTDPELIIVFAAISLRRAGKVEPREVPEVFDRLSDAPFGSSVQLEAGAVEETDEGGPSPPPPRSNSKQDTSGPDSRRSSETSLPPPRRFGMPDSDTSTSARTGSAS